MIQGERTHTTRFAPEHLAPGIAVERAVPKPAICKRGREWGEEEVRLGALVARETFFPFPFRDFKQFYLMGSTRTAR